MAKIEAQPAKTPGARKAGAGKFSETGAHSTTSAYSKTSVYGSPDEAIKGARRALVAFHKAGYPIEVRVSGARVTVRLTGRVDDDLEMLAEFTGRFGDKDPQDGGAIKAKTKTIGELPTTITKARPQFAAYQPGAKARAILLGVEQTERDLADSGGAFELEDVQTLLRGVTPQAVSKRVREGSLLAVPGPSGRRRYPTVQFMNDGAVVPALKDVAKAFPSRNPWMLLNFLVREEPRLATRPIELLKQGDVEPVVAAARAVGMQGA